MIKGTRLSEALEQGRNNFDLLRLCAALAVMFGHSFWIQPAHGRVEPILKHTGLEYSGSLAVYTFFLISGILVSSSFDRQKSVPRFVSLRLARIYPALIACVFLTAFVLYPVVSTVGFGAALTGHDARSYFTTNAWLFSGIQWTLPGIFETAPIKSVVNGSLWTLPIELKCYVLVLLAGVLGCLRSKLRFAAFFAAAAGAFTYLVMHGSGEEWLRALINKPTGYSFYAAPFFLLGMLLYTFRERISVSWGVGVLLLIVYACVRTSAAAAPVFYVTFVYVLLLLASSPALRFARPKHDYSYGVYLWAFPVQQVVASRYPGMDNLLSLLISVPAVLIIAAASWHFVESPCLTFARTRLKRRDAAKEAVPA